MFSVEAYACCACRQGCNRKNICAFCCFHCCLCCLQELFENWYFCQEQKGVGAVLLQCLQHAQTTCFVPTYSLNSLHMQADMEQQCLRSWARPAARFCLLALCLQEYFDWAKPLEESKPVQR